MYEDVAGPTSMMAGREREWERFDRDLELEVRYLLCEMVEADASIPREQRRKFMLVTDMNGACLLHPGLANDHSVVVQDVELLAHYGLLFVTFGRRGTRLFAISPLGRRYYEHLRSDEGQRVAWIEEVTLRHFRTDDFRNRYGAAYESWRRADDLAWSEDAEGRQSEIGHNCRDALVGFVNALVEKHQPEGVEENPEKFLNRLSSVLVDRDVSETVRQALKAYWKYVAALTMRQDHRDRREGAGLLPVDGRRVVFHTALAMFEVDRASRAN